jgi:hypothetical protein
MICLRFIDLNPQTTGVDLTLHSPDEGGNNIDLFSILLEGMTYVIDYREARIIAVLFGLHMIN